MFPQDQGNVRQSKVARDASAQESSGQGGVLDNLM